MTVNTAPKLSAEARAALSAVLARHKDTTPALAFGVTTKDGVIYTGYRGDRVYGKPDDGQVNETTSEPLVPSALCAWIASLVKLQ